MSRLPRLTLALAAGAFALAATALAEEARVTDKTQVISLNPLGFAFGSYNLNYERKVNSSGAWKVGVAFASSSDEVLTVKSETTYVGGLVGYKFYFSPVAMDGWYWNPNLQLMSMSSTVKFSGVKVGDTSAFVTAPGIVAGRQWIWAGGFSLDIALGIAYWIAKADVTAGGYAVGGTYSGVLPSGTFSLGYAF